MFSMIHTVPGPVSFVGLTCLFGWIVPNSERVKGLGNFRIALHKTSVIPCKAQETLHLLSVHRAQIYINHVTKVFYR